MAEQVIIHKVIMVVAVAVVEQLETMATTQMVAHKQVAVVTGHMEHKQDMVFTEVMLETLAIQVVAVEDITVEQVEHITQLITMVVVAVQDTY